MPPARLIVTVAAVAFMSGAVIASWIALGLLAKPSVLQSEVAIAPIVPQLEHPGTAQAVAGTPQAPAVSTPSAPHVEPPRSVAASSPSTDAPAAQNVPAAPGASPSGKVSTAPSASTGKSGAYALRFGAFVEAARAVQMQNVIKRYGFAAEVVPYLAGNKVLQLVEIGGFADRNAADEVAAFMQRDAGIEAIPVRTASK